MRDFLLISLLFVNFAFGFNKDADTSSFKANTNLEVTIKHFNDVKVDVDGSLKEAVWQKAGRLGNFCEIEPHENVKPSQPTEVIIFYDDDNLYLGFICYEDNPASIRKTLTDRDKMFSDDWVGIILDSYSESKQAYELFVNPLGIQGDLMWTAPGNEDASFDAIWYSGAKIYKDRWTAEMVIPFKSIRFPNKTEQSWRFHILRTRPRENREQDSWAPISRDDAMLFTHYGTMSGISNIKSGNNLEVLPYTLSSQAGQISDNSNSDSKFDNEKVKGQVGVNLKYGITSNLTADFTVNPDFSQVESDAAQIDVNSTYALFFSEKRPFFIEGSTIFNTPINVVYTRSINNPLTAFKLTGKIGKYDIGYIAAYDRNSPFIIPYEEGSDFLLTDRRSLSNIFRVKRTLKDDSYIGFILTDREVNKDNKKFLDVDGYNRVFGFDGNVRFLENYSFVFQVLKYISKEINYPDYSDTNRFADGKYTRALDGEKFSGYGNYFEVNRSARHWNFSLDYGDIAPEMRRDLGYCSQTDSRKLETWQSYVFYPESKLINRITPQIYSYIRYSYDGKLKEIFFSPEVNIQFPKQIYLFMQLYCVNNEDFKSVYNQGVRRLNMNLNVNTFGNFTWGAYLNIGKYIVRNEDVPSIGWGYNLELWNTVKPLDRLVLENDWNYFELSRGYKGEKINAGYIFRNKSTLQIDKNFSLRLITQYDSFSGNFNFNPLLSYKLNPFSIFYIGSTYNYDEIENKDGFPHYVLSGRQFFLKFQYLWRI